MYVVLLFGDQELLYTGPLALVRALQDSIDHGGTVVVCEDVVERHMHESYEAYIDDRLSMYAH